MKNMEKLKELAQPLVDFLKENYHPYTKIEITDSNVKIVEDVTLCQMTT